MRNLPALCMSAMLAASHRTFVQQALCLVGILLVPYLVVDAQEPTSALASLSPGTRIRVRELSVNPHRPLVGRVVAVTGDTLTLQAESPAASRGQTVRVAVGMNSRLDVSRGRKSHTLLGPGIGLLVGATAGAVFGSTGTTTPNEFCTKAGCAALGAVLFGSGGLVVGAVAGSLTRTDQWETIWPGVRVGIAPVGHRRIGLEASLPL